MIATLSPPVPVASEALVLLLLGDLRWLLEEPCTAENRRWLLAILDRLLVGQNPASTAASSPCCTQRIPAAPFLPHALVVHLRRLRDRVAHGTAIEAAALDVRKELAPFFTQAMPAPPGSAPCPAWHE
uniref:Uncharacterized protein n=1 Tax=Schlesneria paludicola TaxID=360056 RepID=A0A7C4QHI2_9PLAN